MRSIGLQLDTWQRKGLMRIHAARPTVFGLEMHLVSMHKAVEEFHPHAVVVDPISSLITAGNTHEVKSMLVRLFDYLKTHQITCMVSSLTATSMMEETDIGVSSLIDTWLHVREIEVASERTRVLHVVKSRGMGHSNQVREFLITSAGINLLPVMIGAGGVLTGSARAIDESQQRAEAQAREQEVDRRRRQLERRRAAMEAQIEVMRLQLAAEEDEGRAYAEELELREQRAADAHTRAALTRSRARATNGKRS
jgi:circadian clock protein KaiC